MSIEQMLLEKLRTLPIDQQQEALNFVEFLQTKLQQRSIDQPEANQQVFQDQALPYDEPHQVSVTSEAERSEPESALEAALRVIGTVGDGASDLSTNRSYLAEYGQS